MRTRSPRPVLSLPVVPALSERPGASLTSLRPPLRFFSFLFFLQPNKGIKPTMGILAHKPAFSLFTLLLTLIGACSGGSDAPRGVAVGFVFDVSARCEPPCGHGGVCIRNDTCFCSRGYEGERCQYANCFPKCKNGGTCLRPGKCRCQPGYGGRYCHKVTCADGCWNGGECTAVNGVAKCICPSSWTGSKCQDAICPQGCRNGGFCVAPGICRCPEGWLGGACHTAVCSQTCLNGGKCISPNKCRCRPHFSGPRCEEKKKSH
ncbi:von Willebrand factor D and EGF domain-containing protein [Fundulus heteroclitus]|uniref:von Willebrand factor D and EGF domain-containing protein n=1 Tax=Fundulus heteroclitus TaxID=8078 RepID=UPI00165A39CD|nr:von Willebrand factor D and EGF domain-containing protein [Fundulus heteroclitus]